MHTLSSPLAFLSPLLIAYGAALLAAALAELVKSSRQPAQRRQAFSHRVVVRSEEIRRSVWRACLSEGFFMGNVGFSVWALVGPIEGHPYKPEVQVGALLLLFFSCAVFPFMRALRRSRRCAVVYFLVVLAIYILLRQRL